MNIATPAHHVAASHARGLIFRTENSFAGWDSAASTSLCSAVLAAVTAGAVVASAICSSAAAAGLSRADAERSVGLYNAYCARCHTAGYSAGVEFEQVGSRVGDHRRRRNAAGEQPSEPVEDPAAAVRNVDAQVVLAVGGGRHPMDAYRDFRGREPSTAALLRHNGLS